MCFSSGPLAVLMKLDFDFQTKTNSIYCQAQPKPQLNKVGLSQPYFHITGQPAGHPPARPEQQRSNAASEPSLIIQVQFTLEDNLNERRSQWKTSSMEDDLNGRSPQQQTTSMEDNLNRRRPPWKTTSLHYYYHYVEQFLIFFAKLITLSVENSIKLSICLNSSLS